jgi:hypothetical protein
MSGLPNKAGVAGKICQVRRVQCSAFLLLQCSFSPVGSATFVALCSYGLQRGKISWFFKSALGIHNHTYLLALHAVYPTLMKRFLFA